MYAPRPIITLLDTPAEILGLDLIKEFIGLDPDVDAAQDRVLPVLLQAAIEQGQQITGIVWAAASYRIDGLYPAWPGAGFILPLAPVLAVTEVRGADSSGAPVIVDSSAYTLIPSGIDFGRPWAELRPAGSWPEQALTFSVTCTAGWAADKLPQSIRSWTLNRIATLYDYREDIATGKTTAAAAMPRDHSRGLLDRWTVRSEPNG